VRWATRAGVHIDRAACAWLLRRFIDPDAQFLFVGDPDEVPADATPFDMRGSSCPTTAATAASRPSCAATSWRIVRGLSMVATDQEVVALAG
jgi:hypothetical protein